MAINDGDILSALKGIEINSTKVVNNTAILDNLQDIQQDVQLIRQISQGTQRAAQAAARNAAQAQAQNRVRDTRRTETATTNRSSYQSSNRTTSTNKFSRNRDDRNSFSSTSKGAVNDFLSSFSDGIQEELKKSLKESPLHKQLKASLQNFAKEMGVSVSEIPSILGKDLGKTIIQRSGAGQRFASVLNKAEENIFDRVTNAAKTTMGNYARRNNPNDRRTDDKIFQDTVANFKAKFKQNYGRGEGRTVQAAADRATRSSANTATGVSDISSEYSTLLTSIDTNVLEILNLLRTVNGINVPSPVEEQIGLPQGENRDFQGTAFDDIFDLFRNNSSGGGLLSSLLGISTNAESTALATTGTNALGSVMGAEGAGVATGAGMAIPHVAAAMAAVFVVSKGLSQLGKAFGPAIEGITGFKKALDKAGNRYWESQKAYLENEQKRIEEDIRTIAERPFKIMEAAAQDWYNAWEDNLKTITATQGYTKADVQTLFGSYANRLRSEGLESVISAADISTNLGKVLSGGLSGAAAEEFAYLATILENAIPTQDFFSYSDTYAQVVANARARGLSESDAIQEANAQLQQFASNLLYASRNISGGLSSALQDGKKLWEDSVKIAATARIPNSSNISGVLTSVAAQVGAIAPDLASDLVDRIVSAAIGGNSDQIVALRSIAGVGASNTEFLRILANDPQSLFATLFDNLAKMQQMNADNFMEVAEGLAETFGISFDAFARVDFQALASAISGMEVNTASLSENMALLRSKQTVTSDEQLKMQQINKMILDEGLAYVLDNEAARAIQEHMWQQELANEMAERNYSVELAGEAKKALLGIAETVGNILNFLNPFSWVGKLFNMMASTSEYGAQKADIAQILELGKVGRGNAASFTNLTNFGAFRTVPQLVEMMSGASAFGSINSSTNFLNSLMDVSGYGRFNLTMNGIRNTSNTIAGAILKTTANKIVSSKYSWGLVGKSVGNAIANSATAQVRATASVISSDDNLRKAEAKKINDILGTMDAAVGNMSDRNPWEKPEQTSYADWWQSAVSKFSTKANAEEEFRAALERTGVTEEQMKGQYEAKQAQQASEFTWKRDADIMQYVEEIFPSWQQKLWDKLDEFQADMNAHWTGWRENDWKAGWVETTWKNDWVANAWKNDWLGTAWRKDWLETAWKADWLSAAWDKKWITEAWKKEWINTQWSLNWLGIGSKKGDSTFGWNWKSFMDTIIDRFVKYTTYSEETKYAYTAIDSIKSKEKKKESGDAVLALAKALTTNTTELKDPAVQTNVLLSQILIVLEAIMQAENTSGGATLATTLSALGLGLTSKDTNKHK